MYKFRYWINSKNGKIAIAVISTFLVVVIVFVPLMLLISFSNEINIYAYNRDSNSGTREAFEEAIDFQDDQKYSENVFEVSGNDAMIDKVKKTDNSIGYVSYSTAFQDEAHTIPVDGIDILEFNGQGPEDINNNIDDYDAKRPFNMFLRIESDTAATVSQYMFPYDQNSNDYSSIASGSSIWGSDFSPAPQEAEFLTINSDREARFAVSFLFYNWVLYSEEAEDLLSFPQDYPRYDFSDVFSNYIINTELLEYLNTSSNYGSDPNSPLMIETQGSTSVLETLGRLMDDPDEGFVQECAENDLYVTHDPSHNGSGDAFKADVVGSEDVFLGFQSRGMSSSEAEAWGYDGVKISDNGFYDPDYYQQSSSDNMMYSTFDIDAILFIINENTTYQDENGEIHVPTNIDAEGVNLIYTKNFSWEDLAVYGHVT